MSSKKVMIKELVDWILKPWSFLEEYSTHVSYPIFRDTVLATVIALMGAFSALVIVEPWNTPAPLISELTINGEILKTGEGRSLRLLEMARELLQQRITLRGPGVEYTTTWAALGATVDMDMIDRIMNDLSQKNSLAARYNRDEAEYPGKATMKLPISMVSTAAVESLVVMKEMIDRDPQNARFDFKKEVVVKEQSGRSLDVYTTLAHLDKALAEGSSDVAVAVASVPAETSKGDLDDIRVDTVAGFYETPYSRMHKDKARTHNVKLGASMLDGQVIMPGHLFSFNDTLGDRSEARGFRYAPVIAGGAIVEGMGGGTCQVASTLYAASFFAGLVVEERQPHSRPSTYIKLGLDATVSYPDLDLKIRNTFDYPVVIHYSVDNGIARAEIRAKERSFTVTLLRHVVGTQPFPTRIIEDSSLPVGKEIITQLGVPGYMVRRYKVIERDKVGYRFQSMDKYPPTTQFVHKGTGNAAELKKNGKKLPKADGHKPYRASASLRMVQGPGGLWHESTHN